MTSIRRLTLFVLGTLGLVAATAAPAAAGIALGNHCLPPTDRTPTS